MTETAGKTGTEAAIARLTELGAELEALGWQTRLIAGDRPHPALLIRDAVPGGPDLVEHVYAVELGRHWFYWWTRSCRSDAGEAARIIAGAMRPAAPSPLEAVLDRAGARR